MATLSSAVQLMVNNLHAKMAAGTATPEDQVLISKALALLLAGDTWEQALIAVATEHLNTATTALSNAKVAVDNAKTQMVATNVALDAKTQLLNLVPTVLSKITSIPSTFEVSYVHGAAAIYRTALTTSESYVRRARWALSLDDYDTGVFVSLVGSMDNGGFTFNAYTTISANKVVSSAIVTNPAFGPSSATTFFGLLPSAGGNVLVFALTAGAASAHNPVTSALAFSFTALDNRLYLDPATRKSYCRNADGKLTEITNTAATVVAPEVVLASAAELDAYALARGWVRADDKFCVGNSTSYMDINSIQATDAISNYLNRQASVGSFAGTASNCFLAFNSAAVGKQLTRSLIQSAGLIYCDLIADFPTSGGNPTVGFNRVSYNAAISDPSGDLRQLTVNHYPRYGGFSGNSAGNTSYLTPAELWTFSHLHNAGVFNGGGLDRYNGGSYYYRFISVSFGV